MWEFFAAALAAIAGGLTTYFTNRKATGRDRDVMDFNSSEASINRDFQSAEAQKARQFQEDMYTQYQSPQAMVRQYQEAGLNPALMYGRGVTPVALSSASNGPSGSSASASVGGIAGVDSLISMFSNLAKLPSEVDLMSAQSEDLRASALGKNIQNSYSPQLLEQELQKGTMSVLNSQAALVTSQFQWQLMDSQAQLNYVNAQLSDAQIDQVIADTDKKKLEQVTELLKQRNIIADSELKGETKRLVAAQVVSEQMKPAMLAAQTFMYNQQGTSFSLDNFQKSIDNELSKHTGVSKAVSWPNLLYNVTAHLQRRKDSMDALGKSIGGPVLPDLYDYPTKRFWHRRKN